MSILYIHYNNNGITSISCSHLSNHLINDNLYCNYYDFKNNILTIFDNKHNIDTYDIYNNKWYQSNIKSTFNDKGGCSVYNCTSSIFHLLGCRSNSSHSTLLLNNINLSFNNLYKLKFGILKCYYKSQNLYFLLKETNIIGYKSYLHKRLFEGIIEWYYEYESNNDNKLNQNVTSDVLSQIEVC